MSQKLTTQINAVLGSFGREAESAKKNPNGTVSILIPAKADEWGDVGVYRVAKNIAWGFLATISDSSIEDYYDIEDSSTGKLYHKIIVLPGTLPEVSGQGKRARVESKPKPSFAFGIQEQVWTAVRYNGKPVRIKGEVIARHANQYQVKSNRTGQVYDVPASLMFVQKPDVTVLAQI